jgi:O-acetylserine/cysteine efflux transporter
MPPGRRPFAALTGPCGGSFAPAPDVDAVMKRARSRAGTIGLLLVLAVIWGGSVPLTKLGLRDLPPLTLTALRYLVAAPFFALFLWGRPLPPPRALAAAGGLGVLGIAIGQVAQTLGVREISASVATVISALIPIFVVVFARVRLRQPIRIREACGLAVAFAGVVLVAGGDPRELIASGGTKIGGEALMLLSAVAVALYYVLSLSLVAAHSVITVAALSSLAGAAALVPVSAWELRHAAARITEVGVFVVFYLAVLVTVVGLVIWFSALNRLPASIAAVLQYLQPIVGVAASAALFGDPLGVPFGIGGGLVALGIALSTSGQMRDAQELRLPVPK